LTGPTASRGDRTRPRILLVEDEEMNRILLRASLAQFGDEQVRSAGDIDVILLDVRLPDGSGLELAREFGGRSLPNRPWIMILTASVLPAERDAALASGADRFVSKPYRPDEVVGAIADVLAARAGARPG
jgi:two-component system KDP operon response regulator KdpE